MFYDLIDILKPILATFYFFRLLWHNYIFPFSLEIIGNFEVVYVEIGMIRISHCRDTKTVRYGFYLKEYLWSGLYTYKYTCTPKHHNVVHQLSSFYYWKLISSS